MAQLELHDIAFGYGDPLVRHISFTQESGSVAALVGASGSGKTTILKLVAGFLKPQVGAISIAGKTVADPRQSLAPHKRQVGLVFQQHALLPHLTVRANILFGCKEPGAQKEQLLENLLADFRITHLAERYPHQLSGGEQQRVALARALAAKPSILLMDEPFASIDSVLRRAIRQECIQVLRRNDVTTLLVTHDAEEALELADQIIVLDQGTIQQIGSPHEVYFHPKSMQVASLFGEINRITDPALITQLGGAPGLSEMLVRPESLELSETPTTLSGLITHTHFRGNHHIICMQLGGYAAQIKIHTHRHDYQSGMQVWVKK
jgi:iron(III) transport system ATP-binding protein